MRLTKSMSLHKQLHYEECDFKSDYLFRTYPVSTNLVMPLEINPIRCPTILVQHGMVP